LGVKSAGVGNALMNQIEELIAAFDRVTVDTKGEEFQKTAIVTSLKEYLSHERVLAFFERVIADITEYDLARVECLKILELLDPDQFQGSMQLAQTAARALANDADGLVRQYAAMALGPYCKSEIVRDALTRAVTIDEDLDVRHNALAAIKEGGYSEWAVAVLKRLVGDPDLGRTAQETLVTWGAA
jgi:hypothetical protein